MKWLFALLPVLVWANGPQIRDLKSAETLPLKKVLTPQTVAIVFQSDCASCRVQINDLKCLEENSNIVLLGAFSSEKKLRKELNKYQVKYPAYYADKDILNHLKITESATPQIIKIGLESSVRSIGRKKCSEI